MTLIEEMEMYAHEHDVPIMQKEGIDFMCSFLKEHNLKHVLEIGSAIGYSAIRMAMLDMDIQITTIERDKDRYDQAVEYVKRSGCRTGSHCCLVMHWRQSLREALICCSSMRPRHSTLSFSSAMSHC